MRLAASFAAFSLLAAAAPAMAADYRMPAPPPLPEEVAPVQEFNWGGLYGGIHVNTTAADFNLAQPIGQLAAQAYYAHVAQDLAVGFARVPANGSDQQNGIGGYIGYNWLWEDVVLGLEADFTHLQNKLVDTATSFPWPDGRRRVRGSFEDNVTYTASSRAQLSDYLILKARGGYAMGRFLPYASIGLVVAQQTIAAAYNSTYQEFPVDANGVRTGPATVTSTRNAAYNKTGYNYGGAIGVGLEFAPIDFLVLRAEYQHIAMADFKNLRTSANTFRFGAGLKY